MKNQIATIKNSIHAASSAHNNIVITRNGGVKQKTRREASFSAANQEPLLESDPLAELDSEATRAAINELEIKRRADLSQSISAAAEALVDWVNKNNPDDARERFLEHAYNAAEKIGCRKLNVQESSDIAGECYHRLSKTLAKEKFKQVIRDVIASSSGTAVDCSNGSFLYLRLYRILTNKVVDVLRKRKKFSSLDELGHHEPSVPAKVGLKMSIERCLEIERRFLDETIYRGKPVRNVLGDWSPIRERLYDIPRPPESQIPKRSVQRLMQEFDKALREPQRKQRITRLPLL